MGDTGIAVGAAIVAGAFLAATGLLQQWAASRRPERESLSPRLLISLLHSKVWLLGLGTGAMSYLFQAVALAFGPLALVQPVFLTELIFAAPISVRMRRMRLRAREWIGVLSVPAGLAVGILSAWPRMGDPLAPASAWLGAVGIVSALAAVSVVIGRRTPGTSRASLYAFAAACVMALQSALLSATVALMKQGAVALFTGWQPYTLIPATILGVLLVESSYQAGPLVASMPVMDAVEPSVAIVIGVSLFDETIRTGIWNLTGTAVGLALYFLGIVLLDTSPLTQRLTTQQRADAERQPAGRRCARHPRRGRCRTDERVTPT